jgi:hypothetical protein
VKFRHGTLILLSGILLAGMLSATTIVPVSVEQLAKESSHIIEGTAVQSWADWNPQHTLIFTYTRFQVARSLKGEGLRTVVVKQPGGTAGHYTQKVAGVRHWRNGESAVLFLRPSGAADGTLQVTGLMQGNFLMRASPTGQVTVSNGIPGVSTFEQGRVSTYRGSAMSLSDLESRISKAVQP